jgi:hypothetical protein
MSRPAIRPFAAIAFALCLATGASLAQRNEIASGITHQKAALAALKLDADTKASFTNQLNRAEAALQSGYPLLALYHLQSPWARLGAHAYMESKAGVAKAGNPAYEREWSRLGKELAEKERGLSPVTVRRLPASVRGLIQASRMLSRPYYQSGRLFGLNTTLGQGLYYMGVAPGNIDFALFCQQLPFPASRPAPRLRPLDGELARLESDTLEAYKRSSAEDRPAFNEVNSILKLASELNQARWLEGALHKYLEASAILGMVTAPAPDPGRLASVREQIESSGARLESNSADHSIALLYLQMARKAIEPVNGEVAPAGLKRAAVVTEQVLPRYFNYFSEVDK